MKVEGKHVNIGPRMDKGPKLLLSENMNVKVESRDDKVVLYITDNANPEFYLLITSNKDELKL